MMKKLGRILPFTAANIIQAAVFGIYHLNVIQGAYAFLLGMILGYVANKYKSITASILLHMAVNSSSYLMYLLPDYMLTYIILSSVGCVLVVAALLQVKKVYYNVSI
jgi:membrane protease YdiL (CAAX protease family)